MTEIERKKIIKILEVKLREALDGAGKCKEYNNMEADNSFIMESEDIKGFEHKRLLKKLDLLWDKIKDFEITITDDLETILAKIEAQNIAQGLEVDLYYLEYGSILFYGLFSILLSFLLFLISYFIILKKSDMEKISAYECGFESMSNTREAFYVRFYIVAILFIIFDLEILFLIPYAVAFPEIIAYNIYGHFAVFFFLIIILVGIIYEWKKGALNWD